ncbi:MAG: acetyl-CoA carboxylase biotin carboxyl carrier protein subunit [Frankiales bacterium]|nr:acetyl-CoA carboxylase biotin carboxyl carrier protein subunit [Frankiales bacterium]
MSDAGTARPVLRLVRGTATPEELAAVVAVLAARSGGEVEQEEAAPRSQWGAPQLRRPLPPPGPGVWQASALRT